MVFLTCKSRYDGININFTAKRLDVLYKEMVANMCIICIQKQSGFLAEGQKYKRLEVIIIVILMKATSQNASL